MSSVCNFCGQNGKLVEIPLFSKTLQISGRNDLLGSGCYCSFCKETLNRINNLANNSVKIEQEIENIAAGVKGLLKLRNGQQYENGASPSLPKEDRKVSSKVDFVKKRKDSSDVSPSQRKPSVSILSTEHFTLSQIRSAQQAGRENSDSGIYRFKCSFENCSKTYKTNSAFWLHKKIAHGGGERVSCYFCQSKMTDERRIIEEHMTGLHLMERPYSCKRGNCRFSSASNRNFRKHMMKKHSIEWNAIKESNRRKKPDEYKCSYCSKTFQKNGSLWAHLKTHIDSDKRKQHSCHECGKTYLVASNLKGHMVHEHGLESDGAYRCPYEGCKYPLYSTKSSLSYHLKNHHDLEKVKCECGKELKNGESLKRHKRQCKFIHGSSKVKFCCTFPECASAFKSKSLLIYHTNVMHDEKNFKKLCDVCGRRFRFRTHLDDHLVQTHGGVPCKFCAKTFTNSKLLKSHTKNFHKSMEDFTCRICGCGRSFSSSCKLQNHVELAHNGKHKRICYFCCAHFTSRNKLYGHLLKQHLNETT